MPARGELAGREHFATDVAVVALQHLEPQAAIHEDDVADLDVVDQILVVDADGADFLAALAHPAGAHGEIENLARLQLDGRSDVAGANLRALDVHHDRHVVADAAADLAHALDDRAGPPCLACAMLRRITSAPARMSFSSISSLSVAGPSVKMIFRWRMVEGIEEEKENSSKSDASMECCLSH